MAAFLFAIGPLTASILQNAHAPQPKHGDFGGDMQFLSRFYSPPRAAGESDHFIDLWSGGVMTEFARAHGLTNNRALFIISHGRGRVSGGKRNYALYPAESQLDKKAKVPYYSARDVLRLVGSATAAQIDNLIISGCNAENLLDLHEWKECFPNATNIIHAAAGKDGYDFLLRHVLLYPSAEIKWLYETQDSFSLETKAKLPPKLNLYMASLYRPGENEPFTVQIAGRELLQPPKISIPTSVGTVRIASAPPVQPQVRPVALSLLPNKATTPQPIIIRGQQVADRQSPDFRDSTSRVVLFVDIAAALGLLVLILGIWLLVVELRSSLPKD